MTIKKKTKRELILDTAFDLFIEKGYLDTKIIDISNAAGIGKGTIYEYFESKDNLFYELFKCKVSDSYMDISYLIQKDISCEEKIKEYIEFEILNTSKFSFQKNIIPDVLMKTEALRNPDLVEAIHKLMKFKFSIIYQIIKDGIEKGEFIKTDPLMTTTAIIGAINFFISFNCDLICSMGFLPIEKKQQWDKEEFFTLIFQGLRQ